MLPSNVRFECHLTFCFRRSYGSVRNSSDTFARCSCPRWADRVLLSTAAHAAFTSDAFSSTGLYYNMVGEGENVGECKPVALHASVRV